MEKIHGTSAHVSWKDGKVHYFSGGEKHTNFVSLFDEAELVKRFTEIGHEEITVFGEAYGGKCQGMSETYGKELGFIAFEVRIGESWLSVPQADDVTKKLGIEFVYYTKIPTTIEAIDAERDRPSEQAFRNGCALRDKPETWKISEGVVLRPMIEFQINNGGRIIVKHKRAEFMETATSRDTSVDPEKQKVLDNAQAIANEWVVPMRLTHVLDKLGNPRDMGAIPKIIAAMIEDVEREAEGEIAGERKANHKAIGAATVKLYKDFLNKQLHQNE